MEPKVRGVCPSCDMQMELSPSMEIPSHRPAPPTEFRTYDEGEESGSVIGVIRTGTRSTDECAGVGQVVPPLRETNRESCEREGLTLLCPDGYCIECGCRDEEHYMVTYTDQPQADFVCGVCTADHSKPAVVESGDSIIISLGPTVPLPACMIGECADAE